MGNGAAKEDGHWDLNPGAAAIPGEDHMVLAEKGEVHMALAKKERTRHLWPSGDPVAWVRVRTTWLWGAPFCHEA